MKRKLWTCRSVLEQVTCPQNSVLLIPLGVSFSGERSFPLGSTFQSDGQFALLALIPGSPGCLMMMIWLPLQIPPQAEKVLETGCFPDFLADCTCCCKLIKWHFNVHICLVNAVGMTEGLIDWSHRSVLTNPIFSVSEPEKLRARPQTVVKSPR